MRNAPSQVAAGLGLAVCALVPFVLICCGGQRPDVSATNPNPAPSASPPSSASSEPAEPSRPNAPTPLAAPEASATAEARAAAYVQPPLPPYTGPVPTTCAELDRAIAAAFKEVSCKSTEDCTLGARPCWCSEALAMSAAPRLEAVKAAYEKKDCLHKLPPRACPSCRTPLSVACTDGRCAPTFPQRR